LHLNRYTTLLHRFEMFVMDQCLTHSDDLDHARSQLPDLPSFQNHFFQRIFFGLQDRSMLKSGKKMNQDFSVGGGVCVEVIFRERNKTFPTLTGADEMPGKSPVWCRSNRSLQMQIREG
jgi:hypothetical protein